MSICTALSTTVDRLRIAATVCAVTIAVASTAIAHQDLVPAQNAMAGAQVFGSEGCVKCHAINGLGGTEGPDLASFPRARTFYDLAAAMWNHRPSMVQRMREFGIEQPHLTARETGDLIAFLYTLDYFDPAGDGGKGEELFAEKHCIICHQVGGVGGVVGPDLASRGQFVAPIQVAAAMWNHGPAMSEAMQVVTNPKNRAYSKLGRLSPPARSTHNQTMVDINPAAAGLARPVNDTLSGCVLNRARRNAAQAI